MRRRLPSAFALFAAFGLLELTLLWLAVRRFGWDVVFVEVVVTGALGVFMIRRTGTAVFGRVFRQLDDGTPPSMTAADAALAVLAGVLLVFPGFVGDVMGLILCVGRIRRLAAGQVVRYGSEAIRSRITVIGGPASGRPGAGFTFTTGRARSASTRSPGGVQRDHDVIDVEAEEIFEDDAPQELAPPPGGNGARGSTW
ncbi:MAG: FxsA family protein [Microthrixaceae bacterium]